MTACASLEDVPFPDEPLLPTSTRPFGPAPVRTQAFSHSYARGARRALCGAWRPSPATHRCLLCLGYARSQGVWEVAESGIAHHYLDGRSVCWCGGALLPCRFCAVEAQRRHWPEDWGPQTGW